MTKELKASELSRANYEASLAALDASILSATLLVSSLIFSIGPESITNFDYVVLFGVASSLVLGITGMISHIVKSEQHYNNFKTLHSERR